MKCTRSTLLFPHSTPRAAPRPLPPRSGPTVVAARAISYDLGAACVSLPTQGGPWTAANCSACAGSNCKEVQCSPGQRRRLQSFSCGSSLYQCNFECLTYNTQYR